MTVAVTKGEIMKKIDRRSAVGGLLALASAPASWAAEPPPRTAVMSIVGDSITLVYWVVRTGSRADRNPQRAVPIADNTLDKAVLLAFDDALRSAAPGLEPVLMSWRSTELYELQDAVFEDQPKAKAVRDTLRERLIQAKAQRLVLVTKQRAPARMQLAGNTLGSGNLAGLGFFAQRVELENIETRETGSGFLAPYAYLRASLVDVESMKVLRETSASESMPVMLRNSDSASNPLDALDGPQKYQALVRVITQAANKVVPGLGAER
jgi:hypothetical protein